jgi:hypothetical protein
MSEFLRFGNTVVAVDKIVWVSFQSEDDAEEATLTIHFGSDHDESTIVWGGDFAEKIWAFWVSKTQDRTQEVAE